MRMFDSFDTGRMETGRMETGRRGRQIRVTSSVGVPATRNILSSWSNTSLGIVVVLYKGQ